MQDEKCKKYEYHEIRLKKVGGNMVLSIESSSIGINNALISANYTKNNNLPEETSSKFEIPSEPYVKKDPEEISASSLAKELKEVTACPNCGALFMGGATIETCPNCKEDMQDKEKSNEIKGIEEKLSEKTSSVDSTDKVTGNSAITDVVPVTINL